MKKEKPDIYSYHEKVYGTHGTFTTPAGKVEFLETKARIGSGATDTESRLTRFLRPVREALPSRDMDFNQLLQRDLDDHRVATQLIPYLLKTTERGPAFFPPIVAALLPFDGDLPLDNFPEPSPSRREDDSVACWAGAAFGEAFRFDKAVYEDGEPHVLKIGRLSWNEERAKLVVIDGQHRAMALLALFRTLDTWEGDGEKYKHFYEAPVRELINGIPAGMRTSVFQALELPVTIVWFPELNKLPGSSHQRAARKLFVDVNKTARPPSMSRVLLLSDTSLSAILTRAVLNEFRTNGSETLPISAIEYDHPEREQAASAKWSAISNVAIIHQCIYRAVFGPAKYINDYEARFSGKESVSEGGKFMRATLQLSDVIDATVEDGDRVVQREHVTNDNFPRASLGAIEQQFSKTWALLIVQMLSDLKPYKAHGKALVELRDGWGTHDSTSRLASDSILEGVGMYWTLRDSYEHWRETNRARGQDSLPALAKTDIVKAWEETEKKKDEFESIRAKHYLGSSSQKAVEASKNAFAVFATHACQLGFVLAARSLAHNAELAFEAVPVFVEKVISAANAGLEGECVGGFGRRVCLSREVTHPINLIPKLDSPCAVYFRYLWLEVLGTPEARAVLSSVISQVVIEDAIRDSRRLYLNRLYDIYRTATQKLNPTWAAAKVKEQAQKTAADELFKGLHKWFGLNKDAYDSWLATASATMPPAGTDAEGSTDADDQEDDVTADAAARAIEDMLSDQ
jgi:hypothetical protein